MLAKRKYQPLSNEERAKAIGMILRYLREREGLSQGELCHRLDIKKPTYANYESGRHEPKIEILMQIAYFYDVTMDFITGKSLMGIDKKFDNEEFREMLNNFTADQLNENADKLSTIFENIAFFSVQLKKMNEIMEARPDIKVYLEEQFNKLYGIK